MSDEDTLRTRGAKSHAEVALAKVIAAKPPWTEHKTGSFVFF
ncbi:hypothetical protein [Bradyrhizobium sp. STM 3562]